MILKWSSCGHSLRSQLLSLVVVVLYSIISPLHSHPSLYEQLNQGSSLVISLRQFAQIVHDFSENEKNYFSHNYISNEMTYLDVLPQIKERGIQGGAYLGVGPEQNFTYIAHIQPEIAFIVDIRREALVQHLLYKAIFQLADTRLEFLSLLLCRSIKMESELDGVDSPQQLIDYFARAPDSDAVYAANLDLIQKIISETFLITLTEEEADFLADIYAAFKKVGLEISFQYNPRWGIWKGTPTYADLMLARGPDGGYGNFLASENAYLFVRNLQRTNRVLPLVGDFAGDKALISVGNFLKEHGLTISAFYVSNVEQLLSAASFASFVENMRSLPVDNRSVLIRAIYGNSGNLLTTTLQAIDIFLAD